MQFQSQHHSSTLPLPPLPVAPPATLTEHLSGVARRHGFALEAGRAMWDAVALGRGTMAQFSHAEFGGSGQWMRGGMVMVGDMFNRSLAARVGALADELAQLYDAHPEWATPARPGRAGADSSEWWPAGLHSPATSGAQNGVRYAWFPIEQRLAIERAGAVELYDTHDHIIGGVSQQQGGGSSLSFSSQHGPLDLESLRRVAGAMAARPHAVASAAAVASPASASRAPASSAPVVSPASVAATAAVEPARGRSDEPIDLLQTVDKLADLHQRGVLTDDEFKNKKAELLGRL